MIVVGGGVEVLGKNMRSMQKFWVHMKILGSGENFDFWSKFLI